MDAPARPTLPGAPQGGLAFVTRRPVAITMFVIAIVVFGSVSLAKLRIDLLPEFSYPTLTVRTSWPGAAPEDVEQRISSRTQEALSTLPGVVRTTSISRAATSDVLLDFDWGTNMSFAVQDVREKLDAVFLPQGAERPLILRYDPNLDPILRIGIARAESAGAGATTDLTYLRWLAENRVKRELETLPGVAAVQVRGGLEEEIRVSVDPFKLAAHDLPPSAIGDRLAQENLNASGGSIAEGSTEYLVRTVNEFQDVEEIGDLAIARRGGGVLRIRDVASVERTHAKREVVTRIGGREAVEVAIYREAGANIVRVADGVKAVLFGTPEQRAAAERIGAGEEQRRKEGKPLRPLTYEDRLQADFVAFGLRRDATLEVLSDQSTFIGAAIDDVRDAAIEGALLAVVVILLFLRRLSPTLIIGVSIPISVVVTFAPMFMLDVSLNIMSLGGLALGVGMLVDNAIVVLESITRCRDEGDDLATAAVRGVREVASAVTASTLTTIAVFVPIVFVSGIAGQIFGDQAVTVVSSLLVSLLTAVLLIPMLASRPLLAGGGALVPLGAALAPAPRTRLVWTAARLLPNVLLLLGRVVLSGVTFFVALVAGVVRLGYLVARFCARPLASAFRVGWEALERAYAGALRGALAHRALVLIAAVGLTSAAIGRADDLGVELLPEVHQGEFTAHVKLFVGSPLASTDEVLTELDREVRDIPGVRTTALTVGVEPETLSREIEGPHTARLTVRLAPPGVTGGGADAPITPEHEEQVLAAVRARLERHPAVRSVDFTRPTPFVLESPVAIEVRGHDLDKLAAVAADVQQRLEALPELTNVRSSARAGHPEALVTFDRDKTLEYGLDLATVSNLVRDQVLGAVSTRFGDGGGGEDRIDVRVVGDEKVLATLDDVLSLVVNPGGATPVTLSSVADVRIVQGPAEIRRIGNGRAVLVTADSVGLDLGGVTEKIERSLSTLVTPEDVVVQLGGQKREMDEAQRSMVFALLLAIFLVYVVMAIQFESLIQPLVILLTVPLAAVGVLFALDWLDVPLSVVVFIGLILLAGIVVNNAIVLVDRINQRRAAGMEIDAAILEAGPVRLRPIMMTTATTVLGLLPLTGWLAGIPLVGALGSGEGAELRAPMAITVITGLCASTVLTLVVIPVVYSFVARLDQRSRAARAVAPLPQAVEGAPS